MTFTTSDDSLLIGLHGSEQMWALRSKIVVPKGSITDIRFGPEFKDWHKWELRMPGTGAPGILYAGSFWTEVGWDFLYIKHPHGVVRPTVKNILIIETTEKKYHRIIVSSDAEEAARLKAWWRQG